MIHLQQGDITQLKVDAVVNAANRHLAGGGGVDGAIHRAGGPSIHKACQEIIAKRGPLKDGEAVVTPGGQLSATYIIHTVGPRWQGGEHGESEALANCYRNSLELAKAHRMNSIAFPNISTGIYEYPKEAAAKIAVKTVQEWASENPQGMEKIIFICFDEENYALYHALMQNN